MTVVLSTSVNTEKDEQNEKEPKERKGREVRGEGRVEREGREGGRMGREREEVSSRENNNLQQPQSSCSPEEFKLHALKCQRRHGLAKSHTWKGYKKKASTNE